MNRNYRVAICARKGIEVVQEISIGRLFLNRLDAEAFLERIETDPRAKHAREILKYKFPDAIITAEMKFV